MVDQKVTQLQITFSMHQFKDKKERSEKMSGVPENAVI